MMNEFVDGFMTALFVLLVATGYHPAYRGLVCTT
jgi:hypothetical protein